MSRKNNGSGLGSMPTVAAVARAANVSRATVYAVLNAEKSTNIGVSEAKRKLVKKVALKLGYVRNEAARSLVMGKTHSIGVVVNSLKSGFFADFFTRLDDACYQDGYSMIIGVSEYDKEREARSLRTMLAKRIDAIVLARSHPGYNDDVLNSFLMQGIPVVILGEDDIVSSEYYTVAFDESYIGNLVSEHLWSLGHRNVGYFRPAHPGDLSARMHNNRRDDFGKCWEGLGGGVVHQFSTADAVHGGNDLASALKGMSPADRPTAIVCSCDSLAISTVHALCVRRIAVPGEISVIGCDDIDTSAEIAVPLTTVRLPREELAEGIWGILQEILVNEDGSDTGAKPVRKVLVKPELIARESVARIVQNDRQ